MKVRNDVCSSATAENLIRTLTTFRQVTQLEQSTSTSTSGMETWEPQGEVAAIRATLLTAEEHLHVTLSVFRPGVWGSWKEMCEVENKIRIVRKKMLWEIENLKKVWKDVSDVDWFKCNVLANREILTFNRKWKITEFGSVKPCVKSLSKSLFYSSSLASIHFFFILNFFFSFQFFISSQVISSHSNSFLVIFSRFEADVKLQHGLTLRTASFELSNETSTGRGLHLRLGEMSNRAEVSSQLWND